VCIPDADALRAAAEHTSIDSLVIDREESTVELTDPEASLDVGAVAKGYAAEMIALMLAERGISGYALDFGGNLRVVGEKPDGSGWTSGIKNPDPFAENPYVRTLVISDSALVTSGVYERFFTVDGVNYHHIIDPETLMPGSRYLSVSVHAPSSATADALSTALFNMDFEECEGLVSTLDGVEATFVFFDGTVKICD
jgi:thiamine biosynthesis lipoprotein